MLPKKIWSLVLVLFGVFLLRLPSFFEPHWYGDEEIYLVLGQMMRRGAILYRDIWDNKTPLLYFIYALSPTLLWAKVSATTCVLGTTLGVYFIFKKIWPALLAGVLLSLPLFEGNIANAELYFTAPIVFGACLIYKRKSPVLIGILLALAFMLKVPAVFDFMGLYLADLLTQKFDLKKHLRFYFPMGLVFGVILLAVGGYFFFNHALGDFLIAAFSQNAFYVSIDSGPFSKLTNPLFVRAFLLLLASLILFILFIKKLISRQMVFVFFWFSFSLYGALLSNRPYMHYLLQIIPPLVVLFAHLSEDLKKRWLGTIPIIIIFYFLFTNFKNAFALEPVSYYQNFFDYISERKTWESYVNYFDNRTLNYYQITGFIRENTGKNDPIFVWADAASIYVISERPAAAKFIQAHHLTTIDPKNYDAVIERLKKFQPKYIFVTRPVSFPFPQLEAFLKSNYRSVQVFGNYYVYQNIVPTTPAKWSPNYN